MSVAAKASAEPIGTPINLFNFAWVALVFAAMATAVVIGNLWFLNFVHVLAGGLWTGIDLFMGFVIGPILRRSFRGAPRGDHPADAEDPLHHADIVDHNRNQRLVPRPAARLSRPRLSAILVGRRRAGHRDGPHRARPRLSVADEPSRLFRMRKANPDGAKISAMMSRYFYVVAFQGAMQVAIIVVMARFATGL
jgi:hypothetical protein